jgi:hypothetical protein
MIETLDIVKEINAAIAGGKRSNSAINSKTVDRSSLCQITSSKASAGMFFGNICCQVIERYKRHDALAQMHQHSIYSQPVQPSAKDRIASKQSDLAVRLQKCFLHQIFSQRGITNHAHAYREYTSFVLQVELRESVMVTGLGTGHHNLIAGYFLRLNTVAPESGNQLGIKQRDRGGRSKHTPPSWTWERVLAPGTFCARLLYQGE